MIKYIGNPRNLFVARMVAWEGVAGWRDVAPLDPRLSIVNHSPTGFAWGYWGSGPAQLSFALIADALVSSIEEKHPELRASVLTRARNPALYQTFKQQVVGTWPREEPFEITDSQVLHDVEEIERELAARAVQS